MEGKLRSVYLHDTRNRCESSSRVEKQCQLQLYVLYKVVKKGTIFLYKHTRNLCTVAKIQAAQ